MKKHFTCAAALVFAALICSPSPGKAADVTAALDINSAYVSKAITANDGPVLQPSLDVSIYKGLSFNLWANYDLSDYGDSIKAGEFSEVDLTLTYTLELGMAEWSFGIAEYLFPNGDESSGELITNVTLDFGHGFSGFTKLLYAYDQVYDFYLSAGVGYELGLGEKTALNFKGSVGYAGDDYAEAAAGGTTSGFFDYLLTTGISHQVTDAFTVGANINYVGSLDDDVLPKESLDTRLYGGVNLAYTF